MENAEMIKAMGKRITALRKRLRLSQEELAEKADVSPQMISTAERGAKAIRPENLSKISKALGVSADYLLTGEVIDKDYSLIADKLMKVPSKYLFLIEDVINDCLSIEDGKDLR